MKADNASLPDPDPAALERSRLVAARIRDEIDRAGGWIPFDRYMALALYAEGCGYYAAGAPIFGAEGDFLTAPESGELFARCLARQCADVLARAGDTIVEYGAGSGRLAASLVAALAEQDAAPARYVVVEPSPALRARQREAVTDVARRHGTHFEWHERHPDERQRGVVLANEVLDAMPVSRFVVLDGVPRELGVARSGAGFAWQAGPAPVALPEGALSHDLPDGYASELNPGLGAWLRELAAVLERGVALLIDYGYPRHEYLHPSRRAGTLKCHYRHLSHDDPFLHPGLQDITAAVDFTALADDAAAAGFEVAGFTSQTRFLIACGLERWLRDATGPPSARYELAQEAKRLLLPSEMGQTCRVMALSVGHPHALVGFSDDERHRLAGFAQA